jgi:hypothetical protein
LAQPPGVGRKFLSRQARKARAPSPETFAPAEDPGQVLFHLPVTSYRMTIAYSLGLFERALRPFPAALETYHALRGERSK